MPTLCLISISPFFILLFGWSRSTFTLFFHTYLLSSCLPFAPFPFFCWIDSISIVIILNPKKKKRFKKIKCNMNM
jgi:hypothetical protein